MGRQSRRTKGEQMSSNSNDHRILIQPLKAATIDGLAQKLPVLVRVQAPDAPAASGKVRKPYHLALVIDRSGSMSGTPLHEALRCAGHMVGRMAPDDRAALVVFDDKVRTLVPASPVGDGSAFRQALAAVHAGGSTNLHGGWTAGKDEVLPKAADAALARVILLSDGNANCGEYRETDEIAGFCEGAAKAGVSTSTYGLGRDFNEDLMVAMAKSGAGNHYYGDTADDLFEPFAEEFDFISNLYARNVRLSLAMPEGVSFRLLNDYRVEDRDGFGAIVLPDIAYGSEAWALVELEVSAELANNHEKIMLQAAVSAATPDGEPIAYPDASLYLQAVSAAAWDTLVEDPLVKARLAEVEASRLIETARTAAERGDFETLTRLIAEAEKRFGDNPWVQEILRTLHGLAEERDFVRFRKEAHYSSRKMSGRISAKEEMLASMAGESTLPRFLRRRGEQGKADQDGGEGATK
jgi:Ca-activated chloride channel family protein